VAGGGTEDDVAATLDIARGTARKHFADELRHGRARKQAAVLTLLWRSAQGGNVSAMRFLDGKFDPAAASLGKKQHRAERARNGHEGTHWESLLARKEMLDA
jgi:hypothetical protein